ncbi:hypothetical protein SCLARK_001350 [Spiroplasma clarkii]|nr:hypothetical protein SCLARK_001350 [Spiroplasma clarkii]
MNDLIKDKVVEEELDLQKLPIELKNLFEYKENNMYSDKKLKKSIKIQLQQKSKMMHFILFWRVFKIRLNLTMTKN